jgi:serine/threonine protein kinase
MVDYKINVDLCCITASFSGKFLDCVINKHRPLGSGSYGAVYEATYEELPCAAKVLHTNLFEIQSHRKLLERFEQECELLRTIRHPCIVQFLGIARDPETTLPVLVTELMEESLTKFLERSDTELPIYLQVNFCHDVALALAYLHSRDITHRDLSSNNVLLIAGTRAKVTDFGTSVFKSRGRAIMTSCPGTQAYMAPECFGENVQYSQSIDCFSFGVLAVQIVTRKFPNPTSRLDRAPPPRSIFNFGYNPSQVYMRVVPEVDRRQNHVSLVSRQNPLRQIFMDCLNDTEKARPSARDLCRNLAAIKEGSPLYKESIDNASDYQFSVIQQCDATRDELQSTASELRKTRSDIDDYRRENEKLLLKNQSLEKQISEMGQRVTELEIQVLESEQKQRVRKMM